MDKSFQWLPLEQFERLTPEAKNAYLLKLAQEVEREISEPVPAARDGSTEEAISQSSSASSG